MNETLEMRLEGLAKPVNTKSRSEVVNICPVCKNIIHNCICVKGHTINEQTLYDELPKSALEVQVGGSHYKEYQIQPYEFFLRNKIPHHKAAIIRRILRYDHPTGKGLQDLDKISHEIELIKELEGWNNATYEED